MLHQVTARKAVVMVCVMLVMLCTRCSCAVPTNANTLSFLRGLQTTFPALATVWPSSDDYYCAWKNVSCTQIGEVTVSLSNAVAAADLPEVSTDDVVLYSLTLDVDPATPVTLPESWSRLKHINWLGFLYGVTGQLPASWGGMEALSWFSCAGCDLTGTLPSAWSNMPNLITFFVQGSTNLTGTLPDAWGAMPNLVNMGVTETGVTGTLPPAWASIPRLELLDLTGNRMYGTLPVEWAGVPRLERLSVAGNNFSGNLPNWTKSKMDYLDFSHNALDGTLPEYWSTFNLTYLWLQGNRFCGCEPTSWKNVTVLHAAAAETPASWNNCTVVRSCFGYPAVELGDYEDAARGCFSVSLAIIAIAVTCAAVFA